MDTRLCNSTLWTLAESYRTFGGVQMHGDGRAPLGGTILPALRIFATTMRYENDDAGKARATRSPIRPCSPAAPAPASPYSELHTPGLQHPRLDSMLINYTASLML